MVCGGGETTIQVIYSGKRNCMKTAYFEPFAGIAGDMCIGALIDAGCPADALRGKLAKLQLPQFDLQWEKVMRGPLQGTKAHVIVEEEHHAHRKLGGVLEIVSKANYPQKIYDTIEAVFTVLAKAEGRVHGKAHDEIHFHEVGCYDAIADICGTVIALHLMEIDQVLCGKIHVGSGFVEGTRHGTLPLPAPATAYLLEGLEIFSTGRNMEMVTPTGAALMNVLAHESSPMPSMKLNTIGYGAGTRDPKGLPNLVRVFVGESSNQPTTGTISVIETHLDDMNPEQYECLIERLFVTGAVDVSLTPMQMKKNRPAVCVTVLTPEALKEETAQCVLKHSTAIGLRMHTCERRMLQREAATVNTKWGDIQGKVCWGWGVEKRFTPEYEDCKQVHQAQNVPIGDVYQEAHRAYESQS